MDTCVENDTTLNVPSFLFTSVGGENDLFSQFKKQQKERRGYDSSEVKKTFFSKVNVDFINQQIKNNVYKKSGIKIPDQKWHHLSPILESVFDSLSLNYKDHIAEQLNMLNNTAIKFCTNHILNEIPSRLKVKERVDQIGMPLDDPMSTNSRGSNTIFDNSLFTRRLSKITDKPKNDIYNKRIMP